MNLDTYLRDHSISGADFAAQLGISEASLSRIRRGDQNITRETIRQIVEQTGAQFTKELCSRFQLVADQRNVLGYAVVKDILNSPQCGIDSVNHDPVKIARR